MVNSIIDTERAESVNIARCWDKDDMPAGPSVTRKMSYMTTKCMPQCSTSLDDMFIMSEQERQDSIALDCLWWYEMGRDIAWRYAPILSSPTQGTSVRHEYD